MSLYHKELHEWAGVASWQWPRIVKLFPRPKKTPFLRSRRKGGRPRADDRQAFNAILWLIRSGGAWRRLPREFGSAATARRRLALWLRTGILDRAWRGYLSLLPPSEVRLWKLSFELAALRRQPYWLLTLRVILEMEFGGL